MAYIGEQSFSYDEKSESLRKAFHFLKYEIGSSKREELCTKAKNSPEKKARFEISGYGHFKLKRENGQFTISKTDNY